MTSQKNLFLIRDYHPDDLNFILSSWLQGLYHGNSFYNLMDKKSYYAHYEPYLKALLKKPETIVRVAVHSDDSTVIYGYAVLKDKNTLSWAHTKQIWRRIGIMRELLKPFEIKTVNHLTELGLELKPFDVKFDPFAI